MKNEDKLQLLTEYINEYYIDWMALKHNFYWVDKKEWDISQIRNGYGKPDKQCGNLYIYHYDRSYHPVSIDKWIEIGKPHYKYKP